MTYTNEPIGRVTDRQVPVTVKSYHDRVRWGPIIAGLVVALSTQLILSSLGAAIGLSGLSGSGAPRTEAGDVGSAIGIWSIISLFISLFIGGWVTTRCCGPLNRSTALLNGAILWASTLAIGSWLLASGISGAFGVAASNAGEIINQGVNIPNNPNITAEQTRDIAGNIAKANWYFTFGSLIGLIAALIGAALGAHTPRTNTNTNHEVY
ncbi:conserved hypothetical protein [Gloeothece citriformis PCC 7424]|uniref:PhnA-like protein n=1 Tax=Gloeothece citriformis (strain PCC 7424) TaxID=65393 RepID=B7KD53_GLOC7|nr:hypothetical protein [Gloeothece citriformis]ACK73174.1 conserved hypothetical protein [Gloeothece citriformis PCC 7424]